MRVEEYRELELQGIDIPAGMLTSEESKKELVEIKNQGELKKNFDNDGNKL